MDAETIVGGVCEAYRRDPSEAEHMDPEAIHRQFLFCLLKAAQDPADTATKQVLWAFWLVLPAHIAQLYFPDPDFEAGPEQAPIAPDPERLAEWLARRELGPWAQVLAVAHHFFPPARDEKNGLPPIARLLSAVSPLTHHRAFQFQGLFCQLSMLLKQGASRMKRTEIRCFVPVPVPEERGFYWFFEPYNYKTRKREAGTLVVVFIPLWLAHAS